jgi:hypothetical protein
MDPFPFQKEEYLRLDRSAQNILDNSSEAVAQRRLERFDDRRRYDEPALEADLS